jgi:hypothetical protein
VIIPENVPATNPNTTQEYCEETESGCMAPDATLAPHATVAQGATIKNDDDIKIKNKSSSSKGEESDIGEELEERHPCAVAPRKKESTAEQDFLLVREVYE